MKYKRNNYWKSFLGIEYFKVKYLTQYWLYKLLGITFPKLKSQRDYWSRRGQVYMDEILSSGYLEREIFFQNMLVDELKQLEFKSCFEAGCGFGWNLKRMKEEWSRVRVGGVDFSLSQLNNSNDYLMDLPIGIVNGDNCDMPFRDNAFDVGFSLGVFMNIHPSKINYALMEMTRVCRKYIIHIEYDESETAPKLREKRAFKTNIVSHNYKEIYESFGLEVKKLLTYMDFSEEYYKNQKNIKTHLDRWEGFEGPEKYIFIVIKVIS